MHALFRRTAPWLLAALLIFAACGGDDGDGGNSEGATATPEASRSGFPQEVERSDGEILRLEEPAQRIVSLSPGATEIIYAIGAQEALAAVDLNADYPAEAASFAEKVDAFQPNVEAIAALEPDLVIVATDSDGIVGALDRLSIPVLYIDLDLEVRTVEDVFEQIAIIGRLTDREAAAGELVDALEARVAAIDEELEDVTEGEAVFHELDSTYYTVSEQTFIGNLYQRLKLRNIAGDGDGVAYPQLTQEKIIADNPGIIVLADEEFGVSIESVKARPGWDAIRAVRDDRIFAVDPDIISRPGPRIVDALEQLAEQVYRERFE
jgi:iron complex transport system substrate-binding protein